MSGRTYTINFDEIVVDLSKISIEEAVTDLFKFAFDEMKKMRAEVNKGTFDNYVESIDDSYKTDMQVALEDKGMSIVRGGFEYDREEESKQLEKALARANYEVSRKLSLYDLADAVNAANSGGRRGSTKVSMSILMTALNNRFGLKGEDRITRAEDMQAVISSGRINSDIIISTAMKCARDEDIFKRVYSVAALHKAGKVVVNRKGYFLKGSGVKVAGRYVKPEKRYDYSKYVAESSAGDAYKYIHKSSKVNHQAIERGSFFGQLKNPMTKHNDVWQNQKPLEYDEYDSYGEFAYDAYKLPVGVGLSVAGGLWALGSTSAPVVGSALVDAAKWSGSQLLTQTMARLTIPRLAGSLISGLTTVGIDAMFNPDETWEDRYLIGGISALTSFIAGPVKAAKILFAIGAGSAGYKEYVKGNWSVENIPIIAVKMATSGGLTALTKQTGAFWKSSLQGTFQSEAGNAIYANFMNTLFIKSPLKMLRKAGFYQYKTAKKKNKNEKK